MQHNQQNQTPAQMLFTMRILWGALIVSNFILVFISFFILNVPELKTEVAIENILRVVAGILLIITHVLPKHLFKSGLQRHKKPVDLKILVTNYFTSFIMAMSMSEAITILGFVLVSQSHDANKIIPFAIVGIINSLYFFPSEQRIVQQADQLM